MAFHSNNSNVSFLENFENPLILDLFGIEGNVIYAIILNFPLILISLILYVFMMIRNIKNQKINYRFSYFRLFHVNFFFMTLYIVCGSSYFLEDEPALLGIISSLGFLISVSGIPENFVYSLCLIQSILLIFTKCEKKIRVLGIDFRRDLWTLLFAIILTGAHYCETIQNFEIHGITVAINRFRLLFNVLPFILSLSWLISVKFAKPKNSKNSKKISNTKIGFFLNIILTSSISLISDLISIIFGLLYRSQVSYTFTSFFGFQHFLCIWILSIYLSEKRKIRIWIKKCDRKPSRVDIMPNPT